MKIAQRVIRCRFQRGLGHERGLLKQKRMAVGRRACDGLAGGHAIGCRAIFDAHLAADLLLQLRCQCPGQRIKRAAFRRWHDQAQRLRGIPLQQCMRG